MTLSLLCVSPDTSSDAHQLLRHTYLKNVLLIKNKQHNALSLGSSGHNGEGSVWDHKEPISSSN